MCLEAGFFELLHAELFSYILLQFVKVKLRRAAILNQWQKLCGVLTGYSQLEFFKSLLLLPFGGAMPLPWLICVVYYLLFVMLYTRDG